MIDLTQKTVKDHMKRFQKLVEMKQLISYNKMLKTASKNSS